MDVEFDKRKTEAVKALMKKYGLKQSGSENVLRSFYRQAFLERKEGFVFLTENDGEHQSIVKVLKKFERKGIVEKVMPFSTLSYGVPCWISSIGNGLEIEIHTEWGASDGATWWVRCKTL